MKIFNHEVTAGLLRGWINKNGPDKKQGLYYWDLTSNATEVSFEEGKKAKFAGHNYLYVGNDNNSPVDLTFEDGIAKHEQRLVTLANELWKKEGTKKLLSKYAPAALPAITACSIRSKWGLEGIAKFLHLDEKSRIEYLIKSFESTFKSYMNWDFTFYQETETPLLICDSPLFDFRWRMDTTDENMSFCFMPLGPHAVVTGQPSFRQKINKKSKIILGEVSIPPQSNNKFILSRDPLPLNKANHFNTLTLHRARGWIVGKNKHELLKHADFLQPDNLAERKKSDTVVEIHNGISRRRFPIS